MNIKTKQALSVVLALASSAGTVATAVLAVKEKDKADRLKKKMLETNEKPSKMDDFKLFLRAYWPPMVLYKANATPSISVWRTTCAISAISTSICCSKFCPISVCQKPNADKSSRPLSVARANRRYR